MRLEELALSAVSGSFHTEPPPFPHSFFLLGDFIRQLRVTGGSNTYMQMRQWMNTPSSFLLFFLLEIDPADTCGEGGGLFLCGPTGCGGVHGAIVWFGKACYETFFCS